MEKTLNVNYILPITVHKHNLFFEIKEKAAFVLTDIPKN